MTAIDQGSVVEHTVDAMDYTGTGGIQGNLLAGSRHRCVDRRAGTFYVAGQYILLGIIVINDVECAASGLLVAYRQDACIAADKQFAEEAELLVVAGGNHLLLSDIAVVHEYGVVGEVIANKVGQVSNLCLQAEAIQRSGLVGSHISQRILLGVRALADEVVQRVLYINMVLQIVGIVLGNLLPCGKTLRNGSLDCIVGGNESGVVVVVEELHVVVS